MARATSFIFTFDGLDEEDFWLLEEYADIFRGIFAELLEAVPGEDQAVVLKKNMLRESVGLAVITRAKPSPIVLPEQGQADSKVVPATNEPTKPVVDKRDLFLDALCKLSAKHPKFFFPSDGVGVAKAAQFCAECEVSDLCLEYALERRIEHGVWGGASERERRRILRSRAQGSRSAAAAS